MREPAEPVKKLQAETAHKENIRFGMYAGLLGFSGACLLTALADESSSGLVVASIFLFSAATFSYATTVLAIVFVIHKGQSMHIGHVIVAEDAVKSGISIAGLSLALGLAVYAAKHSWLCSIFMATYAVLAFRHHIKFKRRFDSLIDARDIVPMRAQQRAQTADPASDAPAA